MAMNQKILKLDKKTNTFWVEIKSKIYKAKIENLSNNQISVYIFNFNKSFVFDLKSSEKIIPARLASDTKFSSVTQEFKNSLKSPLAGRIIKINAKPNQFVTKNQPLLVIESMKMENEIRAIDDAFIKSIQIAEGDLVQQNQELIVFEKKGEKYAESKSKYEQKKI